MVFGALIIGDEILSGKRSDRHFARIADLLEARGLRLSWVSTYATIRHASPPACGAALPPATWCFSFGGIGNTPDDHTREAAATA